MYRKLCLYDFNFFLFHQGDLQIAMGQIMFATKLIYEEKFIGKHSIHPMKFLGSEGKIHKNQSFLLLSDHYFIVRKRKELFQNRVLFYFATDIKIKGQYN